MAAVHLVLRRGDQPVKQIVGLHSKSLAAGDFDVGAALVFVRKLIAQFGGAARRERDHLVGKMGVVVGLLVISEAAQRFDHGVLRLRLAGVDHVVDFRHIAEMRMVQRAHRGRDPAIMSVGIAIKLAIAEIAAQQAKLPQVVGDVFADVADRAVGTDDDFLVFLGDLDRSRRLRRRPSRPLRFQILTFPPAASPSNLYSCLRSRRRARRLPSAW